MKKLPIVLSIPHTGRQIPELIADRCLLSPEDIRLNADEGAETIYDLSDHVIALYQQHISRIIIDLNRNPEDRSDNGVIKSHTFHLKPIYRRYPTEEQIDKLIDTYYRPYHQTLTSSATLKGVKIALDCHTMETFGPPLGPDHGQFRPFVCLGNFYGKTCSDKLMFGLGQCLQKVFQEKVTYNHPFYGGYIIEYHSREMPWLQIEFRKDDLMSLNEKRHGLFEALHLWNDKLLSF